jgi:GNAT superfamily N-acetyltransferase
VRRYFEGVLSPAGGGDVLVFVAESAGAVVGMAEVVVNPDPPDHQILVPRRAAQIHTVVLDGQRGKGVGTALVAAAERAAAERGVAVLIAGILAANAEAVDFYARAGFGRHGIHLSKAPAGG